MKFNSILSANLRILLLLFICGLEKFDILSINKLLLFSSSTISIIDRDFYQYILKVSRLK